MWMQQGRICILGKIEFSIDNENAGKNAQVKLYLALLHAWTQSNSILMKEIRHLKTIKNKRNLNTKWLLLQNDQNADTTLLHSHDDMNCRKHVRLSATIGLSLVGDIYSV